MNNMLIIVAVLVIVSLVAILVMRKNKAQQPSTSANKKLEANKKPEANKPKIGAVADQSAINRETVNQAAISVTDPVTKFDSVAIAERFMEQQRYDKAIETLERGLSEKPNDGLLLLQLLNVYMATNQYQDFDRVYQLIQTQGDAATIEQAQQLKGLVSEEHSNSVDSAISRNMRLETEPSINAPNTTFGDIDADQDDLSLGFESSPAIIDTNADTEANSLSTNALDETDYQNDNDDFTLTLDDLEDTDLSDDTLNSFDNKSANEPISVASQATNVDDDFDFGNFSDEKVADGGDTDVLESSVVSESIAADDLITDNELNFDDGFVLDLEVSTIESTSNTDDFDANYQSADEQQEIEDFVFNLDDSSDNISTDTGLPNDANQRIEDTSSQFDDSSFNDFSIGETSLETPTIDAPSEDNVSTDMVFDLTNVVAPAPISQDLDDNISIDDDFVFDTDSVDVEYATEITTFTPVIIDQIVVDTDVTAPVDFDSQFSTDFDFVKTLDSHQITLDLADQYLQLGEYDSAKRLLIEVINSGNSEQQQQAQEMLTRTA